MALSMRWAKRSRVAFQPRTGYGSLALCKVQFFRSSAESVAALEDIDFEGYAVGGLAVGEGQGAMFETLEATTPLMQDRKPRYLMGLASRPIWLAGWRAGLICLIASYQHALGARAGLPTVGR